MTREAEAEANGMTDSKDIVVTQSDREAAKRIHGYVDLDDSNAYSIAEYRIASTEAERNRADKAERERDEAVEALKRLAEGDYPMPHETIYRQDGVHSKHDRCPHGQWMYNGCESCAAVFAQQTITKIEGDKA